MRPQASVGEAQHGLFCGTGRFGQGHERLYCGFGLSNVEFRCADMTSLGYPDGRFDAVVSVFSIFFVPDMERLVRELWRMVRPGGKLAVTTWGPRIFEPAYSRWLAAIKRERPDLYSAFNPWDRITDVESVRVCFGIMASQTPRSWRKTVFSHCAQPRISGSSLLDRDCDGTAMAARTAEGGVPALAMTATAPRASSVVTSGMRAYRPSSQRYSIATFCPSIYPVSPRPLRKAAR
jgi:hypothetical protein